MKRQTKFALPYKLWSCVKLLGGGKAKIALILRDPPESHPWK
jgi:hypothetical protein